LAKAIVPQTYSKVIYTLYLSIVLQKYNFCKRLKNKLWVLDSSSTGGDHTGEAIACFENPPDHLLFEQKYKASIARAFAKERCCPGTVSK